MKMHRVPKVKIKYLDSTMSPWSKDHAFNEFLMAVEGGSGFHACVQDDVDGVFDFHQIFASLKSHAIPLPSLPPQWASGYSLLRCVWWLHLSSAREHMLVVITKDIFLDYHQAKYSPQVLGLSRLTC